jgi:uncharacterized protein YlxP (DUF503 family)
MPRRHPGADQDAGGFAGLLVVDLHFPGARTLKDKRGPLKSILQRLHNAGFSASEVAHHDKWQRSQLAISMVARGSTDIEGLLDEAVRICERPDVDVVVVQRAVLGFDEVEER